MLFSTYSIKRNCADLNLLKYGRKIVILYEFYDMSQREKYIVNYLLSLINDCNNFSRILPAKLHSCTVKISTVGVDDCLGRRLEIFIKSQEEFVLDRRIEVETGSSLPWRLSTIIDVQTFVKNIIENHYSSTNLTTLYDLYLLISSNYTTLSDYNELIFLNSGEYLVLNYRKKVVLSSFLIGDIIHKDIKIISRTITQQQYEAVPGLCAVYSMRFILWWIGIVLCRANNIAPTRCVKYHAIKGPDSFCLASDKYLLMHTIISQTPLSVNELAVAAATDANSAGWFLSTSLALGIVAESDS